MIKTVFKDLIISKSLTVSIEELNLLLTEKNISSALGTALSRGGEFAEIYAEISLINGISLEENKIRQAQSGVSQGIGIRVLHGEKTGYAYSERFDLNDIIKAAKTAAYIAESSNTDGYKPPKINTRKAFEISNIKTYYDNTDIKRKKELIVRANDYAYKFDKRIYQVDSSFWDGTKLVVIANSDGLLTGDQRFMSKFNVAAYVRDGDNRQTGKAGGGGRVGFEYFDKHTPELYTEKAVKLALTNLDARQAPAGPQTVVLGNGWAGILLHEAIGHGLEADFNRKGTSLYSNKIGQKVASELCTVVDDGTIPNLRGTINIDDEGTRGQRKVLIENGILKGYMTDKLNAKLMNLPMTGSGRRESYQHFPMPRMTNTFMMAGSYDPEEIISSVKNGLYAKSFGGGQVDISNGQFVFEVTEGYVIENGKISYPVKGANLIGSGPEVLKNVVMVGKDLEYDPGVGTCGKVDQSVPVGVGLPTCKISEIVVGGTSMEGGK